MASSHSLMAIWSSARSRSTLNRFQNDARALIDSFYMFDLHSVHESFIWVIFDLDSIILKLNLSAFPFQAHEYFENFLEQCVEDH